MKHDPNRKFTGAQAYRRKDGKYGWRMVINGDIRARGTNRHDTIKDAMSKKLGSIDFLSDGDVERLNRALTEFFNGAR